MKKMNKTKIEWCDSTWNPVWGCENNCPYCYARRMAKRIHGNMAAKEFNFLGKSIGYEYNKYVELSTKLKNFRPTWIESNFNKSFPKKPSRIFVNSMSDIKFWKAEWMERVLDKIREYPQHIFQFLTKFPEIYNDYNFPENCWLGITVTNEMDFINMDGFCENEYMGDNLIFYSMEPILEPIGIAMISGFGGWEGWIIIGAETGNRKDKVKPEPQWINDIYQYCRDNKIPLFMKDSIKPYWKGELIREFPGRENESI